MALVMKLQDGGEPDVAHIVTINGKDYDYDVLRLNVMARTPYYITRVKRGKKHKDRITSAVNQYIDALGETVNGKQRMDWFDNYARDYKGELTNLDKRRNFNDENGVAATIIGAVIDETDPITREEKPQFTSSVFSQGLANELFGENAGEPIYNSFMNLDQVVNGQRDNSVRIGEFKRALQAYKGEFDKLYGTRYDFGNGTIEDWSGKLDNIINDLDEGLSPEELYDLDRILGTYNGKNTWSSLFDTTVVPSQAQIEQEYRQQQTAAQQRQNLLDNNYIFHDRDNNEFYLPKTANQGELFDAWYKYMYPEEIDSTEYNISDYEIDELVEKLDALDRALGNINTDEIIQGVNDLWNGDKENQLINDLKSKWNVDSGQLLTLLYFYLLRKKPNLFEDVDNDWCWLKGTYRNNNPILINNDDGSFKQTSQLNIPSLKQKIQEEFQAEMQNNQMVPSQKKGGIMKFQDASGRFKAVNPTSTHNWYEDYFIGEGNLYDSVLKWINDAKTDEEKLNRINTVNNYQLEHQKVANASTWNKDNNEYAYKSEDVGKLQTAFKNLGDLKLNQHIGKIYSKQGYNIAGKRLESDRPEKNYTEDNLYSLVTADRTLLGADWNNINPAQITRIKQLADEAGLEWYQSDENPNWVGLLRLKQQPQEEPAEEEVQEELVEEEPANEVLPVVPEEDQSDTIKNKFKKDKTAIRQQRRLNLRGVGRAIGQFFPNAIASIGRLFSDLKTARRIKNNYNKLKPDILEPEQHASRVEGSLTDVQEGEKIKGEGQILRPDELSSNAEKNEAIRLQREENAEKRFRYYLDLDTKRRRETEQNAEKIAQANTHDRVTKANANIKNINDFLESQADVYAAWQKARGTSIDEFIKENQYNLYNQRNKREKLVSQVLSGRELLDYQNAVRKFDTQWTNNWKQQQLAKYKKMDEFKGKPDKELLEYIGEPSYMQKAYDTQYNSVLNQLGDIYVNRGLQNSLRGGYQFWGQSGVAGMDWGDYINYDNFLNTYFGIQSKKQGGKLLGRRKYANNS